MCLSVFTNSILFMSSGFPSSHSANSVSMALFLGTWLTMRFTSGEIDAQTLVVGRFGKPGILPLFDVWLGSC